MKADDRKEADAVKNDVANEDVTDEDVDMDNKSEVVQSAMDTKKADPVMKGTEKVNSALANGNGEFSMENGRFEAKH